LLLNQNNMESKILKQEKNPFLNREEIVIELSSEIAPKIDEVKEAVGKDSDLTIVKKISSNFGKHVFSADVVVYDNIEAKEKVEVIPKKVRKKMAEEAKAKEEADKKAVEEAKVAKEAESPVEETAEAQIEDANPEEGKEKAREIEEVTPVEEVKEEAPVEKPVEANE